MKLVSVRGALVLTLALAVALVGGASQIEAQGKGTVKIATQSPLSGGQAALGEGIKLGDEVVERAWDVAAEVLRGAPVELDIVIFDRDGKLAGRSAIKPVHAAPPMR